MNTILLNCDIGSAFSFYEVNIDFKCESFDDSTENLLFVHDSDGVALESQWSDL